MSRSVSLSHQPFRMRQLTPDAVANEQGNFTTPSFVSFTADERLIGDSAKNQAAMNPENTVFDIKRLIGRRFDDPTVKKDVESWPFKITDQGGNPMVQVQYLGETKTFSPQEISSMVLTKVSASNVKSTVDLPTDPRIDERSCGDQAG